MSRGARLGLASEAAFHGFAINSRRPALFEQKRFPSTPDRILLVVGRSPHQIHRLESCRYCRFTELDRRLLDRHPAAVGPSEIFLDSGFRRNGVYDNGRVVRGCNETDNRC